jgi:cysteine sulfinate desulfinase/cysteine desulfurase-like protein
MGLEKQESESCIRFSFGKKSQKEDVEKLAELILSLVQIAFLSEISHLQSHKTNYEP